MLWPLVSLHLIWQLNLGERWRRKSWRVSHSVSFAIFIDFSLVHHVQTYIFIIFITLPFRHMIRGYCLFRSWLLTSFVVSFSGYVYLQNSEVDLESSSQNLKSAMIILYSRVYYMAFFRDLRFFIQFKLSRKMLMGPIFCGAFQDGMASRKKLLGWWSFWRLILQLVTLLDR